MTLFPTWPQPLNMTTHWLGELEDQGFTLLARVLSKGELAAADDAIARIYPSLEQYYAAPQDHVWLQGDMFAGLQWFPFGDPILDELPVRTEIVELVEASLGTDDIRLLRASLQAKFAAAADFDQPLHRDYPNHTLLVPGEEPQYRQLGLILYLNDITAQTGATRLVPKSQAPQMTGGDTHFFRTEEEAIAANRHTMRYVDGLYDLEVAVEGPAGSLLIYDLATLHRGAGLTVEQGVRYTLSFAYAAGNSWTERQSWPAMGEDPKFIEFLSQATPRQLRLFGFPPADDPYWTDLTRAAVRARYPGIDL